MLNMVAITVGRVAYIYDIENIIEITVASPNVGEEPTRVPVHVADNMMNNVKSYCHIGDVIGIKGRLKNRDNNLIIEAEKVTFLSSSATSQESEERTDGNE